MHPVLGFFLRVLAFLAGLVFAASLAVAFVLLLAVWALRAGWARLTGRPVAPFVARFHSAEGLRSWRAPAPARNRPARGADVTDVEPKRVIPH